MPQLLGLRSRAWELLPLSSPAATAEARVPWSPCATTRDAAAVRSPRVAMKSGPRSPQPEKDPSDSEDSARPKIKHNEKKQQSSHVDVSKEGGFWKLK